MDNEATNWRIKVLAIGAVSGALLGLATAYLFSRTAEEAGQEPPRIKTADAIKVAIGIIGVMRGIAALGDRKR